jgi:1,2-diacylglycerol 3-alpha-glucosyltransferase
MSSAAIIFENFGPYHIARLQAAAKACDLLAVEVTGKSAIYAWDNDPNAGEFRRVTLVPEANGVDKAEVKIRLEQTLEKFRPSVVVVPGWASTPAWSAMQWCARNRVPMIVLSESTAWDGPRVAWKEAIKRRLIGLFSAALVGGQLHREYLTALGFSPAQIIFGYDAVDNGYFSGRVDAIREDPEKIRLRLGLPRDYFLASARFVEKKNLPRLLEAYAQYRAAQTDPWPLVLLGDGELRSELERQIDTLGLRDHVRLPGFVQYDELPAYYALAGAFVHPSMIEPWGLVVNEALASGLPVLVSNRCGCVPELVQDGVNGFNFDPLDVNALAQRMSQIASPDFPRADFARKGREIVVSWGPERFSKGLSKAIAEALARGPVPAGLVTRALLSVLQRK